MVGLTRSILCSQARRFNRFVGTNCNRDSLGANTNAPNGLYEKQDPIHFDDQFIADFEWALGDYGVFPPVEPFDLPWPSTGPV